MTPALSVVIPTLGDHALLARVLDGYERQDAPAGSFEVIVVGDRAEPDPAAVDAAIGTRPYPVRRLTGGRPGASANRNAGWRAARAPVVLFTDNDTIPTRPLVAEHLRTHAAHPEREVAVIGHVRWAKGLRVTPFMRWVDDGLQFDYASLSGEEAGWAHLYTANASVKRALLELVGGFDEVRLPYLYEDLDWAYRARAHGLRVLYDRRAIVDHWRPVTLEQWRARAARLAVAEATFTRLHPEVPPFFHARFSLAAQTPPGAGRALRLVGLVPRRLPVFGPAVWERAAHHWAQELAPAFMAAWEQAQAAQPEAGPAPAAQPEAGPAPAPAARSEAGSKPGGS
jgi:GT2 family glycosyltransferase